MGGVKQMVVVGTWESCAVGTCAGWEGGLVHTSVIALGMFYYNKLTRQ